MDISNSTSNEQVDPPDIFENIAMDGANDHRAISQDSITLTEESRDDNEIVNSDFVTPYDEVEIPAENAVDEREEESETHESEYEVLNYQNEDEDEVKEEEENDDDGVPHASVKACEYCLLCRARFPVFDSINQPDTISYQEWRLENIDELWQSQIRAVLRLNEDEDESIAITEVVELLRNDIQAPLVGWSPSSSIIIKAAPQLDDPIDRRAYCFHDWCYSIFTWEFGPNKLKLLYEMGTSFEPSTAWQMPAEVKGPLYPQVDYDSLLSSVDDRSAMFQPLLLVNLPPELRSRIWNFVGHTSAYSAFMLLTGETSTLARQIQAPAVRELTLKPGCYINSSFINMYGTQYIRTLTTQNGPGPSSGIKIVETVTGIQVVSSVHGICSIRLLGQNWKSKWMGTFPHTDRCWYGEVPLDNDGLFCFYNGLTIEEMAANHQPTIRQVMWDRPDHPEVTFDADGKLFTLFEPEELYHKRLPALAFFRFIPLTDQEVYASSLTIYFLSKCITGIEVHFPTTSNLVGSRGNVAVHFPLAKDERISNVWLRLETHGAIESVPSLLIRTTLGRDYSFGPYVGPTRYSSYRWVMLKHRGCISGFYFENSTEIRRLGVIGDDNLTEVDEIPLPRYETCDPVRPLIGFLGRTLFMNDAKIQDFKSITICRVGSRCIGMLIHYLDTNMPPVVLGQWLDSERSKHISIYDTYDWIGPPPVKIAFKSSESEPFVQDIKFCGHGLEFLFKQSKDLDTKVEVYEIGARIAWWFTSEWDSIRLWQPRLDDLSRIPVEYELVQD
ncbi:hypothetical protein BELL_0346g00070 [Botrytis elliptica]|uniref:Uncharacterized protein n=1 Tax=Botrytis elliptica TaxID=278938 RepID=A0A4Z1JIR8_9HELO|nr:hypothetical protein BELL_0346g00070 [Botrytis elliptica]